MAIEVHTSSNHRETHENAVEYYVGASDGGHLYLRSAPDSAGDQDIVAIYAPSIWRSAKLVTE
ncbi:hypothetical protein [Amycolatopsis sp. NPDC051371]|uniref:hypothetical protein n=1 Tax=Amycolatopsis sp. NPDC051371 TaxID=3155800 RepID=UPI0034427EAC